VDRHGGVPNERYEYRYRMGIPFRHLRDRRVYLRLGSDERDKRNEERKIKIMKDFLKVALIFGALASTDILVQDERDAGNEKLEQERNNRANMTSDDLFEEAINKRNDELFDEFYPTT
jgi:hypothetical protein